MASGRSHISGALKAAVAAGVLGITGLMAAPSANASVMTVELVPQTATSGTVNGQTVTISGPGTVNFNIYAVLHSQNSTQTDDGVSDIVMSVQTDNPSVIGNTTTTLVSPFNPTGVSQNGTPTNPDGTAASGGVGPDVGSDRVGGPTVNGFALEMYAATNNAGNPILGTANTSGDLVEQIGTGTFTITSLGSTNIVPVLHVDSSGTITGRLEKFQVDGVSYALNGDGHGTVNGVVGTDPTLMNTQGFNIVAAPEPGSLALAGLGGLGLLLRRRRK